MPRQRAQAAAASVPQAAKAPQAQASRLFGRIRQTVACQAAPATLKSAFLEPLSTQLAVELSVEMFGRTDEDFMALFTGKWGVGRRGSRFTARRCGRADNLLRSHLSTAAPTPLLCPPAAAGVLSSLEASRDGLAKRVEGLVRCKNEFSELARCL